MSTRGPGPAIRWRLWSGIWATGVYGAGAGLAFGLGLEPVAAMGLGVAGATAILALCAVIVAVFVTFGPSRVSKGLLRRVETRALRRIAADARGLAARRRASARRGVHGATDPEVWARAQRRYITDEILSGLSTKRRAQFWRRERLIAHWQREIDRAADKVDAARTRASEVAAFRADMAGAEYEALCAKLLRGAGWRVDNIRDTSDQGIDLIARRRREIVAIQCKRYGQAVGNEAVQQIVAARILVDRRARAAVVSNQTYTRAAKELAAANRVLLLHHDDLPRLADLIEDAERPSDLAA